MPTEPEPLLTTADVCRILKVGKSSVYRLIEDGKLVALRVRRSRRYTRAALDAYLAAAAKEGAADAGPKVGR